MLDLSILNPEQRLVVETIAGPVLVLAGAGTGKTKAITMRMAHMIALGVAPESLAAMTFTNKAAREMNERLQQLVGQSLAKRVSLGTFHSFCLQILRQHGGHIGLPPRFALASTSDQIDLLKRALQEEPALSTLNADYLHAEISKAKNAMIEAHSFVCGSHPYFAAIDRSLLQKAYELYDRQLHLNRLIDFDDCIFKTVNLLLNHPNVLETLQSKYKYFLVDEFQDTNASQMKILELLGTKNNNVCVVGDDDQSIYSWRGAMFETLELFEKLFPATKLIKLEQNYRCTNIILNAANTIIKNNSKRKDKTLWSANEGEWPVEVHGLQNDAEEARFIADKCLALVGEGYRPFEIAILYRANSLARFIEMALKEVSIPYETFGGNSFFERKEVKDFLSYVRIIIRPDDRMAFYRIINTPHRGIGIRSLEKIEAFAQKLKKSPWAIVKQIAQLDLGLTPSCRVAIEAFIDQVEQLKAKPLASSEDVKALGHDIITTFHLTKDIHHQTKDPASTERKIDALKSLPQWLAAAATDAQKHNSGVLDPHDLLDRLTLNDRDFSDRAEGAKKDHVSLMTIHASKGLEFPAVLVCGLEEDLFPHKNSVGSPAGVMEERRLFYVALTRAKKKLSLTWCQERGLGSLKTSRSPSRFLAELPGNLNSEPPLNWSAVQAQRREKTVSSLKNLRATLKP